MSRKSPLASAAAPRLPRSTAKSHRGGTVVLHRSAPSSPPEVQLRRELVVRPWTLKPETKWYASTSLRLARFGTLHDIARDKAHAINARRLAAWLAVQGPSVGLQLVLAAHPRRYRAHVGLRIEVERSEIDEAREAVVEITRDLEVMLGGSSGWDLERERASNGGLDWLQGSELAGMAAHPMARPMVVSEDEAVALLPTPSPALYGEGDEMLRIMLEHPEPVVVLVSLRRAAADEGLHDAAHRLSQLHASLTGLQQGAMFTSSQIAAVSKQFPENLMHVAQAVKALERQGSWLAELQRGAMSMQVHLLSAVEPRTSLVQAVQRALLGHDTAWAKLEAEQIDAIKAGPLGALDCPWGPELPVEEGSEDATRFELARLAPVHVAASALCLPHPRHDGLPGIPLDHTPVRRAPLELLHGEGVLLGACTTRTGPTTVRLLLEDAARHVYLVGGTGSGKTTVLNTAMISMLAQGLPFAFFDPHGDQSRDLIERIGDDPDVVVFDPANGVGPSLNVLANDGSQRGIERALESVLSTMFSLYPPEYMGPMFDRYSRALLLPLAVAGEGLAKVSDLAHDKSFRSRCLARLSESEPLHVQVRQFWKEEFDRWSGSTRTDMHTYTLSKYDVLVRSSALRHAFDPNRPQLDLRAIMDEGKTLLVRLPQGELGAVSAWFLGMMVVARFQDAVFARSTTKAATRKPYTLVLDEFQHFLSGGGYGYTNDDRSLGPFLSEARKFGLRLMLAHQHLAQCDQRTREAVFGNVGSMLVFRVGHQDAELLARELDDTVTASELRKLPMYRAVTTLLVNGSPTRPFTLETIPPDQLALPSRRQGA